MEGQLSAGDLMALTKNNGMFGDGIWGIIMLLIVAGIFTGGLGFGCGNRTGVTEEYVANQFTQRDIFNNNTNILTSANQTQKEVLENRYANQLASCNNSKEILNNKYENALAIAQLQKDVLLGNQTMQAQMAQCCCDIKTAVHSEGEATRALINSLDKDRLMYELNQANTAVANAVQTQNILSTMGRWSAYPASSGCGCNV